MANVAGMLQVLKSCIMQVSTAQQAHSRYNLRGRDALSVGPRDFQPPLISIPAPAVNTSSASLHDCTPAEHVSMTAGTALDKSAGNIPRAGSPSYNPVTGSAAPDGPHISHAFHSANSQMDALEEEGMCYADAYLSCAVATTRVALSSRLLHSIGENCNAPMRHGMAVPVHVQTYLACRLIFCHVSCRSSYAYRYTLHNHFLNCNVGLCIALR